MYGQNPHEFHDDSDSEDDEEKRTLFCGNLDDRVTEDLLYEVFLQAGPIDSARIPKDRFGKQRTFGFITYAHKASLLYAMQLYQGLVLYRKAITIKHHGNTQPMPINAISPSYGSKRYNYDNSSSPYNDSPSKNPFQNNYSPDYCANSSKHQQDIPKHASSHKGLHSSASPYQRNRFGNGDRDQDRNRNHNRRRNYNNDSNRHPDQRSSGKSRR